MSLEPQESLSYTRTRAFRAHPATIGLVAALFLLPWGYRIPWDISRAIPLVLLTPPLWFGRELVTRRVDQILQSQGRLLLVGLVFVAATIFSIVGTIHWAASLATACTWCLLILTALLVSQLIKEDARSSQILLGAMVVSVGLSTALHWFRWKTGGPSHFAFYAHPRIMGLHTLSGALAAVGILLQSSRAGTRIAWLLLGILAWGGFFWSGSRSPLLGVAAGGFIWFLKARWRERVQLVASTAVLAIGGLLLSLAFWTDALGLGWWHVAQRSDITQSIEQITSNRSSFWADATGHVMASPWIGHGPDGYSFLTPKLEGMQPHNLILQLLLDVGVAGTVAALLLLANCLWRSWHATKLGAADKAWLAIAAGSLFASQFDGYLYYPIASIPAFLALGACTGAAPVEFVPANRPIHRVAWKCIATVAVAVLLLNCWLFHVAFNRSPPASPDAYIVRLWRVFPSITYNIDNWIDAWSKDFPDEALQTSLYAGRRSQSPEIFRVKSAHLLARRGAFEQAIAQLELARVEVAPEYRATIDYHVNVIRAASGTR